VLMRISAMTEIGNVGCRSAGISALTLGRLHY
jgi:hypothetical protein